MVICRRRIPESKLTVKWDAGIFKSIFSYSSWTFLGSLAFICNTQGLNILFNLFFGPVANAAYAIGNQVQTTVNSFASNFFVATRPPLIKSYSEGDHDYTDKLFYFSSKIIFSLLFVLIVPLFTEVEYVLNIWLDSVEQYMPAFVRLMLVFAMILSVSEPITAVVQAAGKVNVYHGIADTFTLLTLPLSYVAFKMGMAPQVGFIISILVFIIAHVIRLFILRSVYSFSIGRYVRVFILPCLLTVLISSIAIYAFSLLSLHALLNISFAFVIAGVSIWFVVFDKEERANVTNLIVSKLHPSLEE